MNNRAIVNVATGPFVKGQQRLQREFPDEHMVLWTDFYPTYSPTHQEMPYAFKAWALKAASVQRDILLWCDSCICAGPRPLADMWAKIEKDGYYLSRNGFSNYTWTADSAYPALQVTPEENKAIEHVVAGVIGLDLRKAVGKAFLDEYLRLAQSGCFRGPTTNTAQTPCGPSDVKGHRHDQTAASVIAWRLGMELSNPPEWIAYANYAEDGSYHIEQQPQAACLIINGRI